MSDLCRNYKYQAARFPCRGLSTLAIFVLSVLPLMAQEMTSCPMNKTAAGHQADVVEHGDTAMGFPHDKTTHHFRLTQDGGTIEVTVNDAKDSQNVSAIRMHLKHIATMFSDSNFSIPMFVHSQRGGPASPRLRAVSDRGSLLTCGPPHHDALNAIHDFLIFQIRDHQTGCGAPLIL
jgi:hypothetical protein